MAKLGQKYKCTVCNNEVVITAPGKGALSCCGKFMELVGEGFECK